MNLAIDIGNTAVKWATFSGRQLVATGTGMPHDAFAQATRVLVCASGAAVGLPDGVEVLTPLHALPLHINYKTPHTLGTDRIAAACGAHALCPTQACLVVDAGTCITVDFVDAAGTYYGGAIMPGLQMSLAALHNHTNRLPLVDISTYTKAPVLGRSTEECIVAGTLGATMLALAGYVAAYRQKAPDLQVVVTGGDAEKLTATGATAWQHVPHLTLIGLNHIMMHNANE